MRILVTGADGFVGNYLVDRLLARGHQVIAGLQYVNQKYNKPVEISYFHLADQESIYRIVKEAKPDGIIHLAAQSMVKVSWEEPAATLLTNTIGTIQLAKAMKEWAPNAKLVSIGSSEEYGLSSKCSEPLTENHPCFPNNPYATSKLAAGQILMQMARKDNLNIIHVRPFNHFGPGQREGFVVSDFASQIIRIENGMIPPVIKVGDLSAKRDFTDVRDVIEAYIVLIEKKVDTGIYNICSGIPRAIYEILDFLVSQSRVSVRVEIDQQRFRPSDVPVFFGSAAKIYQAIGWQPSKNFEKTLIETMDWWREKISRSMSS